MVMKREHYEFTTKKKKNQQSITCPRIHDLLETQKIFCPLFTSWTLLSQDLAASMASYLNHILAKLTTREGIVMIMVGYGS